jgi:alpha-1,6-mannosyltransferase
MKVCDLAQSYHSASGGIRTYLHEKRRALAEAGAEHVLVVPGSRDGVTVERGGRLRTYTLAGPPIPGCAPYRLLGRPAALAAVLRAEQPDVIEVDGPYLAPWVAFAHRRVWGTAVTAFHHTDIAAAYVRPLAARWLGSRAGRWARRLAAGYVRAVYRRCDLVLAASPAYRRRLRRLGVFPVAHVPLGVDAELFHPARRDPAVRAELGAAPDDLVLIYAGRLDAEKRADVLLDAFLQLPATPRARLVVVGEGPLRPRLAAHAARDPRLVVLPYQADRGRLAALLASADLYVSAAPYETFGLSVVEAQASGLPVVGVRAGAMIERVPDAVGLLAAPHSAAALAAAVTALAQADRRQLGRAARRLVEAEFSWRRTFTRLLDLYRDARARATIRPPARHRPAPPAAVAQPVAR